MHSPDTGLQFSSGSEDSPGTWVLEPEPTDGVSPSKANLLDAWSAVEQRGGNTFLYLALTRDPRGQTGTTSEVFELNQDARRWDNDPNTNAPEIPCRQNGDVLIRFQAHANDPEVDVVMSKWVTQATDPTSGCDTAGTLTTVTTFPADSAQGKANSVAIPANETFLPGALSAIPEPRVFGEVALNLTKLFGAAPFSDPCFSFGSMWIHTIAGGDYGSAMKDFIAPKPLIVRSCSAAGTKFYDRNVNNERDPGEPGVPRFIVWADYAPFNGVRDDTEPYTVTDRRGHYVVKEIHAPQGGYQLRETLLGFPARTSVRCSFPIAGSPPDGFDNGVGGLFPCGWGSPPINPATEPNAEGRDFGNWLPAHLTLVKELWPRNDPGRFNLFVGDTLEAANTPSDGASQRVVIPDVKPGTYNISEQAAGDTNPADYDSTVTCTTTNRRVGTRRRGAEFTGLRLRPGAQATCVFINVRRGAGAIAIRKVGPDTAQAGDTLRFRLVVTNPGAVPLSAVRVTDPLCDGAPRIRVKLDESGHRDPSPTTLDPGDRWIYGCSHDTPPPPAPCEVSTVTNKATVTGDPPTGPPLETDDEITTTLNCPEVPPEPPLPPPEPPGPTPPGPTPPTPASSSANAVAPIGPPVPRAGQLGRASLRVASPCISRVAQARVVGTHISQIRVRLNGRPVSLMRLRILQRQATLLHRVIRPGRYGLAVRVTFNRGSGTPAVTLRRSIRVCASVARQPNFTG